MQHRLSPEDAVRIWKSGDVFSLGRLTQKVQETVDRGGYQILLQWGMNPALDLAYYTATPTFLKERFSGVAVHGFSPPEIHALAERHRTSVAQVIRELKETGLDSIPGGGAGILVDSVRQACLTPQGHNRGVAGGQGSSP